MRGSRPHPDTTCCYVGVIGLNLANWLQVEVMCVTYTLMHVTGATSFSGFFAPAMATTGACAETKELLD